MSRRLIFLSLVAVLTAFSLLATGCKKTPPQASPVLASAPPPPLKTAEVPQQVADMAANFSRVYFDFDSSRLAGSSKSALDDNAKIMTGHPDVKLEIQGHADERGTTDYNLALGQRRANAVYKYMKSQGVASSRLKVVSYGEERPLERGSYESAWSKNRRAEFVITWGDSSSVRGTAEK